MLSKAALVDMISHSYLEKCTNEWTGSNGVKSRRYYGLWEHLWKEKRGVLEMLQRYCEEGCLTKGMTLSDFYKGARKLHMENEWKRDRERYVPRSEKDNWLNILLGF